MHHSPPSAITYPSPPALLPSPTTLLPHLPYSPQPYDLSLPYHQHLPYSLPYDLYTTSPSTRLSIPDPPTLPMCTLLPIHSCALTGYTYYPAHRTHVLHSPPPCPSPHRCTMPPPYLIGSTTQPYLGHLYPPFSSATFIGLIRPIGLIGPTPTRARTGQVIGAIGLIPP